MLVHHFKTFSKILLFIVSLSVGPVFAESESALGSAQKLYKEQRFSEARLVLQSEVKSNPRNASAHYLLGNCLLALKSFAQARDEYRSAAILDPKGQAGEFSRTALALLSQREAGEQKSAQAYASSRPQLQSSAGAGDDRSGMSRSVRAISAETDDRRAILLPEIKGKLADFFRDTESVCERQEADFEGELEDITDIFSGYGRDFKPRLNNKKSSLRYQFNNGRSYSSEQLSKTRDEVAAALSGVGHSTKSSEQLWSDYISELKSWFDTWRDERAELFKYVINYPRVPLDDARPAAINESHLKKLADEQSRLLRISEGIYHEYMNKAASIEDNAKAIDDTYRKQTGSEPVTLVPKGTNVYSRSYQVTPEPSDQSLPFLAKPGKLPVPNMPHQHPSQKPTGTSH